MSTPFVYVPEASPTSPHNPFYSTPQAGHSPFLPPAHLYPTSPYLGPTTPENFNANSVLWPENAAPQFESAYAPSWAPMSNRQRTTSWHGPAPPAPTSPFLRPTAPAFLHTQSAYFTPGHRRAVSWGAANAPAPPLYAAPPAPAAEMVHPWLNADAPSPGFFFDLAPVKFAPLRMVSANPPRGGPITPSEIRETAFHPPRTSLRILHPRIPFWPVDLALPAALAREAPMTPIALGDVLVSLHRAMHERIAHADWETLSEADAQAVTLAFTKRCRGEAVRSGAIPAQLRDREVHERNKGVKRVDFLLGKTVFRGLWKAPEDPEGCVRMATAERA
ncbi:hypothetical protein C8R46DRAFT_939998 [Mycena filopes]|nr:hypothetical protein C8R46DRAFT_939998 [Mycena filopes]